MCVNSKDSFCYNLYVCGRLAPVGHRTSLTLSFEKAYTAYFDSKVDRNVSWAPSFACITCAVSLENWANHKSLVALFVTPVIWTAPQNIRKTVTSANLASQGIGGRLEDLSRILSFLAKSQVSIILAITTQRPLCDQLLSMITPKDQIFLLSKTRK